MFEYFQFETPFSLFKRTLCQQSTEIFQLNSVVFVMGVCVGQEQSVFLCSLFRSGLFLC